MPCRLVEIFGWNAISISLNFCVNGGRTFLRNDMVQLPDCTMLHPKREYIHSQCRGNFKSRFLLIYFSEYRAPNCRMVRGNEKRRGEMRPCLIWGTTSQFVSMGSRKPSVRTVACRAEILRRQLPNTKQENKHGGHFPLIITSVAASSRRTWMENTIKT